MTAARLARVEELFEQVVDLPPAEQSRQLEAACGSDQTLLADVVTLLNADAAGQHRVLDRDLASLAGQLLDEQQAPIGGRFGRYRILRFLGEGGMGRVYLAQRDGLGDKVAVKFLPNAWSSPECRERFAREQQMLANLNHPHIARLYDAGVEKGVPWFAMEYVEGEAITTYCRNRQLGLRARLSLFRTVCEAVSYAHRNLTVHLDLKPSNILVTAEGMVKLLDFGIARSLGGDGGAAEMTRTGLRLLSLNYAAPEQIRGEPLDVQTDIHGLGIVAYELLTGKTPADLTQASATELFRYTEQPVERLSEAAREQPEAAVRAAKSEWNDLDVFCWTALHRERRRRYATAEGLIRDLDHFLNQEPLEAQTDSFRYRLAKFVKRNRRAVIAAAAMLAILVTVILVFTVRLIGARNQALASEARTRRIHQLMLNLFQGDDDSAGPSKALRVVDLLDRGVAEADSLRSEPALQAELRYTFGTLYQKLGHQDRAEPLLVSALGEQLGYLGPDNLDTFKTELALAQLRQDQSRFDEADHLIRDVLEREKRRFSPESVEVATAEGALGGLLEARGDYKRALPLLTHAKQVSVPSSDTAAASNVLGNLTNLYYYLGDTRMSEKLIRESLAFDQRVMGPRHPDVAVDLFDLGNVRLDAGENAAAEALFRQSLEIDLTWFGENHKNTAESLSGLGAALVAEERLAEAEAVLQRALLAFKASTGPQSTRYAVVLGLLGDAAYRQKQLDKAGMFYAQAADAMRHAVGDKSEFYAAQLSGLGRIYVEKHEYRRGEELARQALAILQAAVPAERYTGLTEVRLAAALSGEERYAEAEKEALAGYAILQKKTGAHSLDQQSARKQIRAIYLALNEPSKARQFEESE